MFTTRAATPRDYNKILSDWLTSAGKRKGGVDYATYRPFVESRVPLCTVAQPVDWTDGVAGWACIDGDTLLYTYVSKSYRNLGIATHLLDVPGLRRYAFHREPYSDRLAKLFGLTFVKWEDL